MKTRTLKTTFALMLAVFVMSSAAFAQKDKSKRASPPETATGKIGKATITIDYSSPSVKGRKIWGELVPYDKVWRAGANEATIFKTDREIQIGGKKLPAGKYSLFAIPGQEQWQIILNSETGQWGIKRTGEANRDPAKDVLTVTVKPIKGVMTEKLVYQVHDKGIALKWENLAIPVAIK